MKTVRQLLVMSLMALLPLSVSFAADKSEPGRIPGPTPVHQAKFPINLQSGDYDLVSTIAELAPGAGVPLHMHGGHVLVVVLSGEMTLREKGDERIIKAGESWTEAPGNEHAVTNAGNATARLAISMLLPKGAKDTTIIK